ncbi:hypothetical protein H0H87_004043 [Tephrocybe sp. NHM501043]|nr:hypothetical protein H0H87_004043 [Tephrocybe sp. NHM501043]
MSKVAALREAKFTKGIFTLRKSQKQIQDVTLSGELSEKITHSLIRAKNNIHDGFSRLEQYMKFMTHTEFDSCLEKCLKAQQSIMQAFQEQNERQYSTVTHERYTQLLAEAESQRIQGERAWWHVLSTSIGAKRRAQQDHGLIPAEAGPNLKARLQLIHEAEAKTAAY